MQEIEESTRFMRKSIVRNTMKKSMRKSKVSFAPEGSLIEKIPK